MSDYAPGTPSWVDLGTPDVDASIAFYTGLFDGWSTTEPGPPEAGGYRMFMQRDKMVAGVAPLMSEDQPPAWLSYVSVVDADETADKATQAGGSILLAPMDVLDVGRMALVADPAGAVLGLWQPRRHTGADLVNEPVSLTWNELNTRDAEGAKAFYARALGWGARTHPMGEAEYTEWLLDDEPIGGMMPMGPQVPEQVPPHWLAYFAVADTDATIERAKELGGSLMVGPIDIPAGRFALLTDPHGASFGVIKG